MTRKLETKETQKVTEAQRLNSSKILQDVSQISFKTALIVLSLGLGLQAQAMMADNGPADNPDVVDSAESYQDPDCDTAHNDQRKTFWEIMAAAREQYQPEKECNVGDECFDEMVHETALIDGKPRKPVGQYGYPARAVLRLTGLSERDSETLCTGFCTGPNEVMTSAACAYNYDRAGKPTRVGPERFGWTMLPNQNGVYEERGFRMTPKTDETSVPGADVRTEVAVYTVLGDVCQQVGWLGKYTKGGVKERDKGFEGFLPQPKPEAEKMNELCGETGNPLYAPEPGLTAWEEELDRVGPNGTEFSEWPMMLSPQLCSFTFASDINRGRQLTVTTNVDVTGVHKGQILHDGSLWKKGSGGPLVYREMDGSYTAVALNHSHRVFDENGNNILDIENPIVQQYSKNNLNFANFLDALDRFEGTEDGRQARNDGLEL